MTRADTHPSSLPAFQHSNIPGFHYSMKIAFSTSGADLSAPLDTRFGRAPKFLVYDTDAATFALVDNAQNLNAAQGAGIQSAQRVST